VNDLLTSTPGVTSGFARKASRFWSIFCNPVIQIVFGVGFTVILPVLVRWPELLVTFDLRDWLLVTAVGCMLSFAAGNLITRQILRFPMAQGSSHVVPTLLICFAILFGILVMGRFEFSRYLIITSFILSVIWCLAYVHGLNRMRRLTLGIVPFGTARNLTFDQKVASSVVIGPDRSIAGCDAVVADLRADLPGPWERFLADCALARVPVYHVKQIHEWLTGRVHIEHLSENQFGSLLVPRYYEMFKRVVDLLLALILSPLLIVIVGTIAILIKLEGGGPIFFVQQRMGFRGTTFRMIKFRTMHPEHQGLDYTVADDDRVTRLGKYLRRHRLDELPQVINILRGDMSWIGPRPESLALAEWYERDVPFYRYRHIVRPGISGWAQVHQGQTAGLNEAMEKLQFDFFYIKHFSPWLDLLIAMKSAKILLTGHGAR